MPGKPLLGNTLDFLRDTTGFLRRAYREHGPVYRIRMLWLKFTVLLGYEAKEFLAKGGERHLDRHPIFDPVGAQLGSADFALAVSGEGHLQLRHLLQLAYSREVASAYVPNFIAAVQEVVREWQPGSRRPVFESIQLLAFQQYCQVMGRCSLRTHYADCRKVTDMNMEVGGRVLPLWMFHWPPYRSARQRVLKLVHGIVEARLRDTSPAAHAHPPDIIDTLMAVRFPEGRAMTKDEVVCYAMYGFAGSCSYMGRLVAFMLYEIFRHPELHAQLTVEVDTAFARGLKTSEDVEQMRLLRAVYHETLRFHPVSQGMPYVAKEEFEFQGKRVAQGDLVVLSQLPLLFAEKAFREPDKFDPTRCLEPRNEHRKHGAFMPFGMHTRICAAMGLVELMSLTLVATLLHEQTLTMDPADYQLRLVVKPLPAPDGAFQMRSEPRSTRNPATLSIDPIAEEVCFADFPGADKPEVQAALREGKTVMCAPRSAIIKEGEEADAFYLLLEGQAEVSRLDSAGHPAVQAVLEPGDYFGEVGLLRHAPRAATVRVSSEQPAIVLRLSAASFRKIVAESDMVSHEIARVARKRTSRSRIIQLVRELAPDVLASRLPDFTRREHAPGAVILRQGDEPDYFHLLVQGEVHVTRHGEDQAEHEVVTLETGRYFGETGMLYGSRRNATVSVGAEASAVTYACDARCFRYLVGEAGDLAVALVRRLKGAGSGATSIF